MNDSGWINEDMFLYSLKNFLKFKYNGKVLLILKNHEATQVMTLSGSAQTTT
jgi:hypothetical protein